MGNFGGMLAAGQSISYADKGADLVVALIAAAIVGLAGLIAGKGGKTPGAPTSSFKQVRGNSGVVVQSDGDVRDTRIYNNHQTIHQNVTVTHGGTTPASGEAEWCPFVVAVVVGLVTALGFVSYSDLAFGLLVGAASGGAVGLLVAVVRSVRSRVIGDIRVVRVIVLVVVLAVEAVLIVTIALHGRPWAGHTLLDYQDFAAGVRGDAPHWSLEYPLAVGGALTGSSVWLGAFLLTLVFLSALLAVFFAIVEVFQWQNMLRITTGRGSDRAMQRARAFGAAPIRADLIPVLAPAVIVAFTWFIDTAASGALSG